MVPGLDISLRECAAEFMRRLAGKGRRSALFIEQESRADVRAQLAAGARARAARDLQLAEEWFPIDSSDVRGGIR